jgi:hypothetical protein
MRIRSILAISAVSGAALVMLGVPASASPGLGFSISPDRVAQGATVTVTVTRACGDATEAYADSPAIFDRIKMTDKGAGSFEAQERYVATLRYVPMSSMSCVDRRATLFRWHSRSLPLRRGASRVAARTPAAVVSRRTPNPRPA